MTVSISDFIIPFVELNDLKRTTSAGRSGSIATRLFAEAWAGVVGGLDISRLSWRIAGQALSAARLGDIDLQLLQSSGVSSDAAVGVLRGAIEAVGLSLPVAVLRQIDIALDEHPETSASCPAFVDDLARQPRAGITCPGRPRILLEPPENHADHCLMVAVYGVLLSPSYAADAGRVFLAALAHHFHNAGLPDSGFTGEMLLGDHLAPVIAHHTEACLRQLAPSLRGTVEEARAILPDASSPEGRAFHAADVLDRVLQVAQYMRVGALTMERALGEMELVHAGPVKTFQDDILRRAGLL